MKEEIAKARELKREIFSRQLKHYSKRMGLSQRELAEKTGISQPAIASYQSGKRVARGEYLIRLCDVLNVKPSQLLYSDKKIEQLLKHAVFKKANNIPLTQEETFILGDYPGADCNSISQSNEASICIRSAIMTAANYLEEDQLLLVFSMMTQMVSDPFGVKELLEFKEKHPSINWTYDPF